MGTSEHTRNQQGNRTTNPFPTDYDHDLDTINKLNEYQETYYQSQIRILHWIVELERVDIATEVSLLVSHVALTRMGHLQTVFVIMMLEKQCQWKSN